MTLCPTCGREMPRLRAKAIYAETDAATVYDAMRLGKDLYVAQSGGWYLTSGGGAVADEAVRAVRQMDGINPAYSNTADCLRFGPTIDVDATQAARAAGTIGRRDLIYANNSAQARVEQDDATGGK